MAESTTIRWEQDEDGIVILTLDDPNQSANTMNARLRRIDGRDGRAPGGREGRDHRRGHHLRQEDLLRRRRPQRPQAGDPRERRPSSPRWCATARRSCAGWRRSASRSSPRSTAPRSAAASRSRWPTHHRIAVDDPKVQMGFPEVQLGLLPGAGGVVRTVRMIGIVDALMQLLMQGQRLRPDKAKEIGHPRRDRREPRGARAGRQGVDQASKAGEEPSHSRGTSRATRSPAARRRTRSSPRTCRRSRRTCASS